MAHLNDDDERGIVVGQGADVLLGLTAARKLATGTDGKPQDTSVVCSLVCTAHDKPSTSQGIADTRGGRAAFARGGASVAVAERSERVTRGDEMRALGLEPRTSGLKGRCSTN